MVYIELEQGTSEYRRAMRQRLSDAPVGMLVAELERRGYEVPELDAEAAAFREGDGE